MQVHVLLYAYHDKTRAVETMDTSTTDAVMPAIAGTSIYIIIPQNPTVVTRLWPVSVACYHYVN